jgi:3',5'-cyclic AMP phosphodiesterase CpdA
MPLHLLHSRRDFIAQSIGLGLSLAATGQAAADANTMAILADPHIASDPKRELRGICMATHLQQTVADVLAWETRPSGVIVNGDCAVTKGLPGDYAVFADLLKPLIDAEIPLHMTMGNHDDRGPFFGRFAAQRQAAPPLPDKIVSVLETPHANWFLLDSLDQVNVTTGRIGDAQFSWLAKALDARPDRPALIVCHHNLQPEAGNKGGVADSPALLDLLRPRRQVKAYMFGHQHRWQHRKDESGIHLINLPAIAYVFDKKQPSGWVQAQTEATELKLTLRALKQDHPAHGQRLNLAYR